MRPRLGVRYAGLLKFPWTEGNRGSGTERDRLCLCFIRSMTLLCKDICIAKPLSFTHRPIVEKERDNFSLCIFCFMESCLRLFFFFFFGGGLVVLCEFYFEFVVLLVSIHAVQLDLYFAFLCILFFSSFFLLSRKE